MDEKVEVRDCILKAAVERILHYGYAKTTMAEIAKDCDMSAGNIYRFFKSKLDIAEAMARKHNSEVFQSYAELAREDTRSAEERLKDMLVSRMERTYHLLASDAKLLEVAEVLSNERPEFSNEELAQERIYIVKIIQDGMSGGEFKQINDPNFTAEMIQSATMKFGYPQLWSHLDLPSLRRELEGVFDLIVKGISIPHDHETVMTE